MYETDDTINESNSPVSHPNSPSITGTNSKSGRESFLSSTSSGHSENTSFSFTTETCSSSPHFLPLSITPLATIQNVERLLLQRNYVNSVLKENGFQETFIDHIADDLCTSPKSQLVEVINNDDEDMDSHNHSLLRDLKSVEGPFKHHTNIQHSNTYLPTRNLSSRIPKPSGLLPNESSGLTSIHIQPSVSRSPRHLKSDVYSKYLRLLPLVSSDNLFHRRSTLNQSFVTNLNVYLTSPVCCTQTLVSSKTSVPTSSSLQSLLQRSSEILPLMTRSGIEKPNVSNLHSVENPNAFVVKKTDCRSVRRRSTTNVSISDILSLTSTSLSVPGKQSFQGEKLVVKAKRQLQDVFSVMAGNFSSWLIQLIPDLESSYTSDSDQNRGQIDKRSPTSFLSHIIHDNQPTFIISLHGGGCSTTNFVSSSSSSDSTSLLIQLNAFSQSSFNTHLFDHSSGLSSTSSQEHKGLDNGRNNLGTCGRYHLRLALSPNFCRHKVTVN
ncbi:unnamed protein product [Schistosoma rodhaini]|uniref:Uncharacterized protein n=1 Tax=Schistosoma rodhaini TaxID=6188 RepID=A0AA85F3S9_9TREM|nr:unnamed protein product [Schistosoma rodhaini]